MKININNEDVSTKRFKQDWHMLTLIYNIYTFAFVVFFGVVFFFFYL